MADKKLPKPGELERELNDYLTKKYGDRVRLSVPFSVPDPDSPSRGSKGKRKKESPEIKFDMKPRELEAYLDDYVIGQEGAKEILSTKICTHFNRIKLQERSSPVGNIKNNIIMLGPTGVGKTFLVKLIARKIGVPFVKGDATKFSETGYVGGDVEDLVRDLVSEADGSIERAQYGIIYIDEIDKIAGNKNTWGIDVSRTGVQRALLKPMEETEVDLKVPHDMVSQMEAVEHYRRTGKRQKRIINTRNILFIMSGAFSDIEKIIEERVHRKGIGFGALLPEARRRGELLHLVSSEDLVNAGFESEFIGRLPVIATFTHLSADDLYAVLKNPNSTVVNSKKRDFMAYGIDIRFEDDALRAIAEIASNEHTGARGLVSAMERVLLKYEKTLPSTDIRQLVVTQEMVESGAEEYDRFMSGADGSRLAARHAELIAAESRELKERMLAAQATMPAEWRDFLEEEYIDTIVSLSVKRYLDYRKVLEDATAVMADIHVFESNFCGRHAIEIHLDGSACKKVIENVLMDGAATAKLLSELFDNYHHGLKLIRDRTGTNSFILTHEAIESPQDFLNNLIKDSYV